MRLVYENEESGHNLYQLLQAMSRFLPLLPSVPNLASLAGRRSGHLQAKDNIRRAFLKQLEDLYNDFLAQQIEQGERERIWETAVAQLNDAFSHFSVDNLTLAVAESRQAKFREQADDTLSALLLDSLSALTGEQLVTALKGHVQKQQDNWRKLIGEEEYANFQRLLLLDAIDREWRDYLTAMDDLRREIGLESIAQKDPKVEYKKRSFEMFADMRHNIEMDVADRFFRQVQSHQTYIKRQQAEVAYQLQAQGAGFQAVKRADGKGVELRRDAPKVGRNDPCPCGSGKKYKQCHGRRGSTSSSAGNGTAEKAPSASQQQATRAKKKNNKQKRRR